MKITRNEKVFLDALSVHEKVSAVRLRADLNWDVAKFSRIFQQLMGRGFLTRDGMMLGIATQSELPLSLRLQREEGDEANLYLSEIQAPRLDVSKPYLPDYERFKAAMAKQLYTQGVNVDHPD